MAPAEELPPGTIYTCPMHPEIRQIGPGSCGMALEPELATADSGPNPELADMTQRFWICLVLALPVVALEMGGHLVDLHGIVSQTTSNWIQLALATMRPRLPQLTSASPWEVEPMSRSKARASRS